MTTRLTSRSRPRGDRTELTPEEAALLFRLTVFVTGRWIAIFSVVITTLLATQVFHIGFAPLPVYILCAVMALYNFMLFRQTRSLRAEASGFTLQKRRGLRTHRLRDKDQRTTPLIERVRTLGNIHIALDLVALTILLHFTGGIENPFIFFFVFHVIIAAILLHYRVAYILATLAVFLVVLLVGLEYSRVIPHYHLEGFTSPTLYQQKTYVLGVLLALTISLYASAYMVANISGELKKRQREVVALKDSGLREKTKELRETAAELARLEKGREQLLRFLRMAAHDLKAPLSAIQSYLQLMVSGFTGEMTDKQKHLLDRSSQRITGLLNLISDLLDISRIEAGQIVHEIEEVSLSQPIEDSVDNVRNLAEQKKIELEVEMPQSLPPIRHSRVRLQQVITNLLHNAVKYTPDNGSIKLRVTEQESNIRVEVMDTGVGITAEELPKIFDDFYRGSDTEKAGAGLGLAIAKRIVEAHGGQIWAESPNPEDKLGRGCKFTFTLPKISVLADKKLEKEVREEEGGIVKTRTNLPKSEKAG